MIDKTAGFIGGGRVARIILGGLKKAGSMPGSIVVSDANGDTLEKLRSDHPEIRIVTNNNSEAAGKETEWINLKLVWELVKNKDACINYIRKEVRTCLAKG